MIFKLIHENCSGCSTCRLACALENFKEVNPSKGLLKIEGRFPAPGDYRIHFCDQCGECAEACPVEAIHLENGVYILHEDECTSCMTCVEVCPNEVMFERSDSEFPTKCIACGACASICPRDAIVEAEGQDKEVA